RRPSIGDLTLYERVLGCRPRFGVSDDRLLIDANVAALRMQRSNAEVHHKARDFAQELLGQTPSTEARCVTESYSSD
ncbi:MAG TPA: hypothetical protein VJR89_38315, partial [Polyangiales bacterium]|nr:hypothetical protein [Polyangiales bacterium]